jgi:hypothetical protein
MSYKILMGESITYVHLYVRPSVRPYVRPSPLILPYRFPHKDFIGHQLPKGPMFYKILMGESVTYVHPSVRTSVHPYVRLSSPPDAALQVPHKDFIGHRYLWEPMPRHPTPKPLHPGHQGTNDHYRFLQSVSICSRPQVLVFFHDFYCNPLEILA